MSNITPLQYREMLDRLNRFAGRGVNSHAIVSAASESDAVRRERGLHDEIILECNRRGWLRVHSRLDVPATVEIGTPDFIILADGGRTFAIECKARDGKLRPEQRAWLAMASKLGHKAAVVRSFSEFVNFVEGE